MTITLPAGWRYDGSDGRDLFQPIAPDPDTP